jgi:hypothetical protein
VDIYFKADVDNSWFYIYGELVNDETNETFSFERTIERYHGYADGEYWSEGSDNAHAFIAQVPAGKYYLNLDFDNGGNSAPQEKACLLFLKRDVPTFLNYFWCLFLISALPICVWIKCRKDEVARWSDSDFSPYVSRS